MSFEGYFVDRDQRPAYQYEATFTDRYVRQYCAEAEAEGRVVEAVGEGGDTFVRVTLESHVDGRPWVYTEFYAVEGSK